ncbi:Barstar, RNAse (barnase) inhibitor [Paraburkholderia caribensis MBA4]|uniref:Barstar, RNAse (Barnase) inhibitor n=1 Tax=Paraburkholderia caribensis MBA4 TaxID=1323664 RepID=A0A0P0R937_9BURK|nr:barstar family protein [Paraburkholderia caribensis]ALL64728.1 Barstar, RNAse (barnase) inhibitor [Paraburkholderia caribensis MBA4]
MKLVKVTADLSGVKSILDFYERMADLFKFPKYFGNNADALIDCLFGLRYPESEMTGFNISDSECLLLEIFGFSSLPDDVAKTLTVSVEFVNLKCSYKNQLPSIILLLNGRA